MADAGTPQDPAGQNPDISTTAPEATDPSAVAAKAALASMMRSQHLRQQRLRHVQEFLTSPSFLDMRDEPLDVSDDAAALAARRHDLDYQIAVLEAVLALLIEERDLLDRTQSASPESKNQT